MNTKQVKVILYHSDTPDLLKNSIKQIIDWGYHPIIINDNANYDTYHELREFTDKIDIIHFEKLRGWDAAILSSFRHIIRGTGAEIVITVMLGRDNIHYIKQIVDTYYEEPHTMYIVNRVKTRESFLHRSLRKFYTFIVKYLYRFDAYDHLSTYALFELNFLKTAQVDRMTNTNFLLTRLYLLASLKKQNHYKWIGVGEEKVDKLSSLIMSFMTLW